MENNSGHPTARVLTQARQDLDEIRVHGESTTLTFWSVLCSTTNLFTSYLCPDNFMLTLSISEEVVYEKHKHKPKSLALAKVFLATGAAECLARQGVRLIGPWEDAVQAVIALVRHWDPSIIYDIGRLQSDILKQWILAVFCDANLCPNYNIRLEMLRMIQMWHNCGLESQAVGARAASGLLQLSVYLDAEHHLVPDDTGTSLDLPWFRLLYNLNNYDHLRGVFAQAILQIKGLSVGAEARWLASVPELLSAKTALVKEKLESGSLNEFKAMQALELSLVLMGQLVCNQSNVETYNCPGLARVAAVALIDITYSILAVLPALMATYSSRSSLMMRTLNYTFLVVGLSPKSPYLLATLRRDHGEDLARFTQQSSSLGLPLQRLPEAQEDNTQECPERYLDGLTQSVMEAPVLLQTSNVAVDESTLVYLLLVSPRCPFTRTPLNHDSFRRLPDLQEEIRAWRAGGTTSHHRSQPEGDSEA